MTITAEQRRLAEETAKARDARHEAAGHPRHWRPADGAEAHRIGLLGEFAFGNLLGEGRPDLAFLPAGDGGVDLEFRGHPVDVKVSTYTGPGQYLRVPVDRWHAGAIYVAAIYDREADDVALLRWAWGRDVERDGVTVQFRGQPNHNYVLPLAHCRRLADLEEVRPCDPPA